ncbi:MAG TPA: YraN family protein [Cytophagales bacterium]|nr:YraN family protein [Cytophagales bacterium]
MWFYVLVKIALRESKPSKTKTQIGKKAEEQAARFLSQKGFDVQLFNYRYSRAEIDIIAIEKGILVFVEVKYRTNVLFGYPESFVDTAKAQRIKLAAENYIFEKNWKQDIRFDVVAIVEIQNKVTIEHFVDCF